MALINKIREKTGLAVGIITFGLILFLVGGDLLGPNSVILSKNKLIVGEIAGIPIERSEYLEQIEEFKYNNYTIRGITPNEGQLITLRQQAWDYLIVKKAFQIEYDKLNIDVSNEELVDMVQGKNIHPTLVYEFTDPQTGQFNRDRIVTYLQNISNMPPQQQATWYMFESSLKPSRLRIKYDNLLVKSTYVTSQEGEQKYYSDNNTAEVKYLYIPYYTVNDSMVNPTDANLKAYLNDHKEDYKISEGRSLNYVSFDITPTADDSLYFLNEMNKIAEEIKEIDDDSIYSRINTDGANPFNTFTIGRLPARLKDTYETVQKGDIIGPYRQAGNYIIHKISDVIEDTVSHARASQIFVRATSQSTVDKADARKKAQDLLRKLRNGDDFAFLARNNSDDPSARVGGDLGWFDENKLNTEKAFLDAVFAASRKGLIPRVIEGESGYYLVDVTGVKTSKLFKVATVEREITASDLTRDEAFRKADYFASISANLEEFERNTAKDSLTIGEVDEIEKTDRSISGLGNAREIIRWMYVDASVGEVSEVFELDDQYVVAVLTSTQEEGYATVDDVRDQLLPKVRNELKGDYIIDKLKEREGTIDEIAEGYGNDASVYSNSNLKLSTNALSTIGSAPKTIGTLFSLDEGQISAPIKENDGVVMIQLVTLIKSPEIADYTTYVSILAQDRLGKESGNLSDAIREFADIQDERYKFF